MSGRYILRLAIILGKIERNVYVRIVLGINNFILNLIDFGLEMLLFKLILMLFKGGTIAKHIFLFRYFAFFNQLNCFLFPMANFLLWRQTLAC
jgi:hypothetical protein